MDDQLLQNLEEAPDRFAAEVDELSDSELVKRPPDDGWNLKELAGHMRDTERAAFLDRLSLILSEDNPTVPTFDEQAVAANSSAGTMPIGDALSEWKALREQMVALLRGLGPAEEVRTGQHPERGPMTPVSLAELAHDHDTNHLQQALTLKGLSRDPSS
ncbi:MAG: DinB family protein [Chloroflexia bacterium]|nr:DinB family protein [Chloroflexia bacterium]